MPIYTTNGPVSAVLELAVANVRITTGDHAKATVEVRPTDDTTKNDIELAERTTVDFTDGTLRVHVPRRPKAYTFKSDGGSVDLAIELPAGSAVEADAWIVDLKADGLLGGCKLKTTSGGIALASTGALDLTTGSGDITVDHVAGEAKLTTESGKVRVQRIDGPATVKNTDGDTWIGQASADLTATASNGNITVDHAYASARAKSSVGSVRIGEVSQGEITLETSDGHLEVGVREGVAVWLDVRSGYGTVHNSLDASGTPGQSEQTVRVHAYNAHGDITIGRTQS